MKGLESGRGARIGGMCRVNGEMNMDGDRQGSYTS